MALSARFDGDPDKMLRQLVKAWRDEATKAVAEETKAVEARLRSRAPNRELAASVRSEITGRFRRTGRVHVGEGVRPYVAGYEYGSVRLPKTPFVRPTALLSEDPFVARAKARIGKVR